MTNIWTILWKIVSLEGAYLKFYHCFSIVRETSSTSKLVHAATIEGLSSSFLQNYPLYYQCCSMQNHCIAWWTYVQKSYLFICSGVITLAFFHLTHECYLHLFSSAFYCVPLLQNYVLQIFFSLSLIQCAGENQNM